jgi:hypothetical protein
MKLTTYLDAINLFKLLKYSKGEATFVPVNAIWS